MQAMADASGLPVDVVAVHEGAAFGAAYLARLAAGLETSFEGAGTVGPGGLPGGPRRRLAGGGRQAVHPLSRPRSDPLIAPGRPARRAVA